jgi:hypothetical protein
VRRWGAPFALLLIALAPAVVSAQVNDPPVIIDAYERARNQGKTDAALAYFHDDATVFLQEQGPTTFVGKVEIRRFLQFFETRSPPLITSSRHVVGNTVTWREREQVERRTSRDLTVEALIQDGKIKSLVYSRSALPTGQGRPEEALARVPAAAALGGLALFATGLLAFASILPRRPASASTLHGKLLVGLSRWRATG